MKTPMPQETFANVWEAIGETAEETASLQARAQMMHQIGELVKSKGWKQVEAARHCGVTQPRLNDLLRGRISKFSLDALVNIATALGQRVKIEIEAA
jgi:predicted XRE-type DNA-binding protein